MVDLFFIISGFGMMLGYGDKVFDRKILFKDFFLKRLKKLYPLFIFSTVIVFILELVYRHKVGETFIYPNFDIYHVIQNMLFLQAGILGTEFSLNAPSWCIPICLFCYCMFYYIISRVTEKLHILYSFCVAGICGLALVASGISFPLFNGQIGRGVSGFSVGVILYFVYLSRVKFNSMKVGYCSLIFCLLTYLILRFKSVDYSGNFTLAMALGIGPMIIMGSVFVPWVNKLLSNPILSYLGKISWEIYLLHFGVQCSIKIVDVYFDMNIDFSSDIVWMVYVILTVMIASLYHFLCERKINDFVLGYFAVKQKMNDCHSVELT